MEPSRELLLQITTRREASKLPIPAVKDGESDWMGWVSLMERGNSFVLSERANSIVRFIRKKRFLYLDYFVANGFTVPALGAHFNVY
jgi:hypothetical protein